MGKTPELNRSSIRRCVRAALEEDAAWKDVTSSLLGLSGRSAVAEIQSLSRGVIAGLEIASAAFVEIDPDLQFDALVSEGADIEPDAVIARISGNAGAIMAAERTALNFLQRLSGIATLTRAYVRAVAGSGVTVLDTRKTTPLLREFEKYAVRIAGGSNHRSSVSEMVLVKENHIRSAGGIETVMRALSSRAARVPVEVEIDSLNLLGIFLGTPVNRIMLDNFTPDDVAAALDMIARYRLSHPGYDPEIEVSGGISLENIRRYALPGVHFISIGALTHSAPVLDLTLEVLAQD